MRDELREYGQAVVKHFLAVLGGGVLGAVGLASLRWQFHVPTWVWFTACGLSFFWVQFAAWRDMRAQRNGAIAEANAKQQPVLIGGAGGSGSVAGGGVVVGGSGGGVAYGENAVGEGGKPGVSAFDSLASASLNMGYPLEEFIRLAGFDPHSDELDRIGVGGDSHGVTQGGGGLVLVQAQDEEGRTIIAPAPADELPQARCANRRFEVRQLEVGMVDGELGQDRLVVAQRLGRRIAACEDELIPGPDRSRRAVDDQRRLLYVSLTRPRHYLFVTYAAYRPGEQSYRLQVPPQRSYCSFLTDYLRPS